MVTYNGTALDDVITPTLNSTGNPVVDPLQPATIFGFAGQDIITGGNLNDNLFGGADDDILDGGDGNDYLDGGTGADEMSGGSGNNRYIVDNAGDVVNTTTGFDEIWIFTPTAITYDMSANAVNTQNLTLFQTFSVIDHNVIGNALANKIIGNNGNNQISGGGGNDTLYGNGGDDTIDGDEGADLMSGGLGNDTFFVDNPLDVIQETSADPVTFNQVFSTVSYTLSSFIYQLTLEGSDDINGTGNAWDNMIIGNTGSNRLDGGLGADILDGGGGDSGDTFIVDNPGDRVIASGTGDYTANPNPTGAGVNTIFSSITLDLNGSVVQSGNVYNLILTGTSDIDGTGNDLANFIRGNRGANRLNGGDGTDYLYGLDGNDTLDGGSGNDHLIGGRGADTFIESPGNDTYYVDNGGDVVTGVGQGNNRVISTVTYTISDNVQNLTLSGFSPINGTGNNGTNFLVGNNANNQLFGMGGNDYLSGEGGDDLLTGGIGKDQLSGGAGGDRFAFAGVPFAQLGVDSIVDFNSAEGDKIQLSRAIFTELIGSVGGGLVASQFETVTDYNSATTSTAIIVYSSSTGNLYYNSNGDEAGLGNGGMFATLWDNPILTAGSFVQAP